MDSKSKLINSANKMMEELRGNCAQAIFATYGPQIGLENIDYESCMKIASAFGGGINLTGNVCGAITGTLMTLGLKYGGSVFFHVLNKHPRVYRFLKRWFVQIPLDLRWTCQHDSRLQNELPDQHL